MVKYVILGKSGNVVYSTVSTNDAISYVCKYGGKIETRLIPDKIKKY